MPTSSVGPRRLIFPGWAALLIVSALYLAYRNSFDGPFVFDDSASIEHNPTIRQLWPPNLALHPPGGGVTVSGRPILNLSLALNYAAGGLRVRGYHVCNLAIHALATLTLYGIALLTLARTPLGRRPGQARAAAIAIALLWGLHPLATESVTYTIQRAESLMGLLYLLTLYAFLRGATANSRAQVRGWHGASIFFCFCGMGTKEVMATAPLIVLLYDRTFLSGGFISALRNRRGYYAGLCAAWLPLVFLVAGASSRGGTAGLGLGWHAIRLYAEAQFPAIVRYLRLSIWPAPLIFDYGTGWERGAGPWLIPALGVATLLILTVYLLFRRPTAGFLGAWFFLILAPSSSFIPIATERMAEHRMYLPLIAVIAAGVYPAFAFVARNPKRARGEIWLLVGWLALAGLAGALTFARNSTYRSAIALWGDTVAKRPDNAFARNNLAVALDQAGAAGSAIAHFEAALRADPSDSKVHNNFGRTLTRAGRRVEAAEQFRQAIATDPQNAEAYNNLGVIEGMGGRFDEAIAHFRRAVALKPEYPEAHSNLGRALLQSGHPAEAAAESALARRLQIPAR